MPALWHSCANRAPGGADLRTDHADRRKAEAASSGVFARRFGQCLNIQNPKSEIRRSVAPLFDGRVYRSTLPPAGSRNTRMRFNGGPSRNPGARKRGAKRERVRRGDDSGSHVARLGELDIAWAGQRGEA